MSKKIIDFIDLTKTLSLEITNRNIHLANEVISLDSDDSFISEVKNNDSPTKKPKSIQSVTKKKRATKNSSSIEQVNNQSIYNFGECPICMDKLGENPLASTKCGHVFCMTCLQRSLLKDKKCPTCRCSLRKKSEYHPLYLNFNKFS